MTMAGIYCRISDDREGLAHGVETQEADGRALCDREGLTVYDVYVDNDISASTKARKERPDYRRLLADARAGRVQVIVALSSSRLTRKPREHEDQIELAQWHGVRYLFSKSPSLDLNTADGRRVARMLAANDAGDAEKTAELVKRDVVRRAQAGEFHGGPRGYGLTADGRGLVDVEADRIREWATHVMAGGQLGTLAHLMNVAGELTPAGNEWKPWVIRRVLLAPRIAGLRVVDGAEYPAAHPEIVKPDVWRALVTKLTDPARRVHQQGPARRHLGTALYVCDRCDQNVRANYHHDGYRTYRCPVCFRTWRADPLDEFVVGTVEVALADEDRRRRLLPRNTPGVDLAGLRAEAAAIGQNIETLAIGFATASGRTLAALQSGIAEGEKRLAEIEAVLAAAGRADGLAAVATAEDPVATWRRLDLARRQAVVRGLMEIRLGPPIRGRAKWAPEKFLGTSRWSGDEQTWADHWISST